MSAASAAAAAAALLSRRTYNYNPLTSHPRYTETPVESIFSYTRNIGSSLLSGRPVPHPCVPGLYESKKRQDWADFCRYLRSRLPALALERWSGVHVVEYLKYLNQFGETKVHSEGCPGFGKGKNLAPADCPCPVQQHSGSLEAVVGRLRVAFEENRGGPGTNPFTTREVGLYLREIRDAQAKSRGIAK